MTCPIMPSREEQMQDRVCEDHREGYHCDWVENCPLCEQQKKDEDETPT